MNKPINSWAMFDITAEMVWLAFRLDLISMENKIEAYDQLYLLIDRSIPYGIDCRTKLAKD